jgi:hypothetical protein
MRSNLRHGFALVAALLLIPLVLMVGVGMLSLSAIELRKSNQQNHAAIAKSNAKLALMLALGELQKHAGPDQRATTKAAILESSGATIPNRNWLGVWKTTYPQGSREWPVIGKRPAGAGNESPYSLAGAYEDLRHTQSTLNGGKWRNEMRLAWLVSKRSAAIDASTELDPADPNVVELLGRGALGDAMDEAEYSNNRILVEKVDVGSDGAFAWHISDESQKASIVPVSDPRTDALAFEAAAQTNPALVKVGEELPFGNLNSNLKPHVGKFATYGTVGLALTTDTQRAKLRQLGNHFTIDSSGLFTNPVTGGLKRDLTPLLLARKNDPSVDFAMSNGGASFTFSSRLPIIPGQEHGVLGPGFDALRDWAQHAHTNLENAETNFPTSAVRIRPTTNWAHSISDGAASDASNWAAQAPKIHPVMTDVRWHYYFSHHNGRIRTHIIPRVCLWNPYSRPLKIPDLSVLMPNPYFNVSHGMHFFPEESHANALKATGVYPFSKWVKKSGYVGGDVYKMRMNPFPTQRYLAFTLEGTTIGAGECHVFSPKVTSPLVSAAGVNLQMYQQTNPSQNVLSSSAPQGVDHFYFDHTSSITYQIQALPNTPTGTTVDWRNLTAAQVNQVDLGRIFDYQPELSLQTAGSVEGFPFVLKAGTSTSLTNLHSNTSNPSLQLVFFGGGGAHSTNSFAYQGNQWGSANQQDNSFGFLERFADAPMKDSPDTHQVGAKILWLDERGTEGNAPPLRANRWPINHMALNVAPVANWNVRAQLSVRSPAAQVANKYYMTSAGAWYLQFVPYSPQNVNDQPSLNSSNRFVKNPFGASVDYSFFPNVVLFDLPSSGHGVLSMARLRHAMLSPYSWNPSYIVGQSLRDLHAPSDKTAHPVAVNSSIVGAFPTRWDSLLGAAAGVSTHGARTTASDSQGLLQIGNQAVSKSVSGGSFSSSDEILAYDIAYEVNQNLWDGFFLSSIPLSNDTERFAWNVEEPLTNPRYHYNPDGSLASADVPGILTGADSLKNGFYRSAEFLHNTAAFNVNSTSVEAWTAFLCSTLGKKLPLRDGELGDDELSFARHSLPSAAADTDEAEPDSWGAWAGARKLSSDEVRVLAENIVIEVKRRGPFLSLADFINRRLADRNDETSHMSALDAAIMAAGLNDDFSSDTIHQTTSLNAAPGSAADERDNNHPDFRNGYRYQDSSGQFTTTQPQSKAWGMPGYLTQGDLLEPLAPALTTRGDTFVIRAYGESKDDSGIQARAWVEATVVRTPLYLEHRDSGQAGTVGNTPLDSALDMNHSSGQITEGNLSVTNRRFGRQFKVKSFRWLHHDEI